MTPFVAEGKRFEVSVEGLGPGDAVKNELKAVKQQLEEARCASSPEPLLCSPFAFLVEFGFFLSSGLGSALWHSGTCHWQLSKNSCDKEDRDNNRE